MFCAGIDPFTKQGVFVARHLRDRNLQRALMQLCKTENRFAVREAFSQAGRSILVTGAASQHGAVGRSETACSFRAGFLFTPRFVARPHIDLREGRNGRTMGTQSKRQAHGNE